MLKKSCSFRNVSNYRSGFTIVEFLIATAVFGTIMLVLVLGLLSITDNFYKGINNSNTQDTARNIINTLAQAIQFGDSSGTTPMKQSNQEQNSEFFCIGHDQVNYLLGYEQETNPNSNLNQSSNVLLIYHFASAGCPSTPPTNGSTTPNTIYCAFSTGCGVSGTELMGQNMRLANLSVTFLGNGLWKIDVRVVYGADNVLCSPSLASLDPPPNGLTQDCDYPGTSPWLTQPDLTCKPSNERQFCTVSELTTIVQQRV